MGCPPQNGVIDGAGAKRISPNGKFAQELGDIGITVDDLSVWFGESYRQSTEVDDEAVEAGELDENLDEDGEIGENDAMSTVLPKETPPKGKGKSGSNTPHRNAPHRRIPTSPTVHRSHRKADRC